MRKLVFLSNKKFRKWRLLRLFANITVLLYLAIMATVFYAAKKVWDMEQTYCLPVQNMDKYSFEDDSFWYYPWGKSVVHKGADVFAPVGRPVLSATQGYVVYSGYSPRAGHALVILGPKWRLHFYAHLNSLETCKGNWVQCGEPIGTLGKSGNAQGKQAHLHYSIYTVFPDYSLFEDCAITPYRKMYYVNPIPLFYDVLNKGKKKKTTNANTTPANATATTKNNKEAKPPAKNSSVKKTGSKK